MSELIKAKKNWFHLLDRKARNIAYKLTRKQKITKLLLKYIAELYDCANTEEDYSRENFKSAYHQSITSNLEFLVSRILYHFSNMNHLAWTINLRQPKKDRNSGQMVAPDIKIEKEGKIVAIMEIKAKAGWMQPFFSEKREQKDIEMGRDPKGIITKSRDQLLKYAQLESCGKDKIFVFLPTFIHVNRKKYENSGDNYRETFAKNSTLKKENLILLSENTSLDLAINREKKDYAPTNDFENFIKTIAQI